MHKKYGLSLVDQTLNSNKTKRKLKLTKYGFLKIISTQNPCYMLALGARNDLTCFTDFVQNFKACLTVMFTIWSVKECMSILLLLDMFYED
jgi:hypothetical protein